MEIDLAPYRRARRGELAEEIEFGLPAGPTPLGHGVRLAEPAAVAARLAGGSLAVRVEVSAHLALVQPCDRCLEAVQLEVPVDYVEEWALQGPAEHLDADDAEVVRRTVSGDTGSLDDGFWQNVALEMPVKVLCAEDCRGLCPQCGVNRNRTPCACREPGDDPRLAALAQFRPAPRR